MCARSWESGAARLTERCIHPDQLLGDPRPLRTYILRPGCEKEAICLVFDPLAHGRALCGCLESPRLDEALIAQPRHSRAHVLRTLMRQKIRERGVVRRLLAPQPCEHLDFRSGATRGTPRGHVAVVAPLPQAVDRGVELRERTGRWLAVAIPKRKSCVDALVRFGRVGS